MSLEDFRLHDAPAIATPAPGPAPPRGSAARWIVAGILGLLAGSGLTFWWMSRAQPSTATPAPTTATDVAVASTRPKRQAIDLPPLDESDPLLRQLVTTLSQHPTLARFLASKGLIRATALAVVQIGDGKTPAAPLKAMKPAGTVMIDGPASGHIDPKTYARWDGATSALLSIKTSDAAQLYVNVKPLLDQAYSELGHPGGDFDAAIVRAIGMLDETPTPTDEPVLLRRPYGFEHDDQTLRALPPVQKQFLLIGPDNRKRVMAWLKQFASVLELKLQ
jgi:hypothetical protein